MRNLRICLNHLKQGKLQAIEPQPFFKPRQPTHPLENTCPPTP